MIVPRIQRRQLARVKAFCGFNWKISFDAADADRAVRCLKLLLPMLSVSVCDCEPTLRAVKAPMQTEAFRIRIAESIDIQYGDYLGLRNALSTIASLLTADENGCTLPMGEIEDAPVIGHRGIMFDMGRDVGPLEQLLGDMVLMAKAKMNVLHLHIFDHVGCAIDLPCLPRECVFQKHYTVDQIKTIVDTAYVLGLEIIPEFDLPAHSKKLARYTPSVACRVEENTFWTTCAGAEETYVLYEKIIHSIHELFPGGRYFHIGGDELEFTDLPHLNYLCHWDGCPVCREKMARENLRDRQALYYYCINRIHKIVKGTGRRMIMWNDQIDCSRPCPLSREILLHFWQIPAPGRGPRDGHTLDALLEMGFEVINSYYDETYLDMERYFSPEKYADWRWDRRPESDTKHRARILGSECCAWSYGGTLDPRFRPDQFTFYSRVMPAAIFVAGDKLWSGADIQEDEAYRIALTKAVVGPYTPDGMNLWKVFGSIVPPRDPDKLFYEDRVRCTADEVAQLEAALRSIPAWEKSFHLAAYVETLSKIQLQINSKS